MALNVMDLEPVRYSVYHHEFPQQVSKCTGGGSRHVERLPEKGNAERHAGSNSCTPGTVESTGCDCSNPDSCELPQPISSNLEVCAVVRRGVRGI